jgi:hypothetical protein
MEFSMFCRATRLQLMNFYDLYMDSPQGPTTKLEENRTADVDYFNGDRRYF